MNFILENRHRLAELSGLTRHEAELMMDMVRICGAKTDIADRKSLTAIDVAARCGNQELVRLWTKYSKVPSTFEPGSFVGYDTFHLIYMNHDFIY